jgi:flagellar basal body P-ring protein FlgI
VPLARDLADLAGIQGVRQKELIGCGLVVGLNRAATR